MDLRANTAVDVLIGPFLDKTDGNTTEDGLTLTAAEIKLSKNGQALTLKNDATAAAFDDDGYYNCELDATDANTEGQLVLIVHQSANALPVRHEYDVLSEAAWDSLYAAKDTGYMDVNIKAIDEDETAPVNSKLQWNGTGLLGDGFPLRQDQGASISGGLAVRSNMTSVTVIQGSEQDLANTNTSDDTRWTGDDDAAGAEFIFRCTPADTTAEPGDLHFEGYYDEPSGASNGATLSVYNFQLAAWEAHINLTNASSDETHDVALSHINGAPGSGTLETVGYTIGDVLIKFEQDTTETGNACLLIDRMYVGFISAPVTAAEIVNEWESQSQAAPTGFHVNVIKIGGTTQTANDNGADINAILGDTNELQADWANDGRLDLLIDQILVDTATTIPALVTTLDTVTDGLAAKFIGITLLAQWLGAMAGSQTADATALTEMAATGVGSGAFDEANESLEAIRARGDSAWSSAGTTEIEVEGNSTLVKGNAS